MGFLRLRETDGRHVPAADMRVLGVHLSLGADIARVPGHQLRGDGRDADVHHGLVQHAGAVRYRRAQATRLGPDAGHRASRLLGRRAAARGRYAVLAIRAHVRRRHARGQRDDVHDTSRLGGQVRRHRLARRAHIPHVDAVDEAHARQVRRRVCAPVPRLG